MIFDQCTSSLRVQYVLLFTSCSIYLALDSCDATGTGLRVTEYSAVTATVLSGHSDSSQFVFLFNVNLLYPRGAQQSPALFSGERL